MARVKVYIDRAAIEYVERGPNGPVHVNINRRTIKVHARARTLAPVRTGNLKSKLRRKVTTTRSGVTGRVTSPVKYSMYVHEGTKGPYFIVPKNLRNISNREFIKRTDRELAGKKVKRFKGALYWKGAPHPVRRVTHPGIKAQPFLREALEAARD